MQAWQGGYFFVRLILESALRCTSSPPRACFLPNRKVRIRVGTGLSTVYMAQRRAWCLRGDAGKRTLARLVHVSGETGAPAGERVGDG